jgi:hypothetical protein
VPPQWASDPETQKQVDNTANLIHDLMNRSYKRQRAFDAILELSPEVIRRTPNQELLPLILEFAMRKAPRCLYRLTDLKKLPVPVRRICVLDWLNGQVANGGFDKYFRYASSKFVPSILEACSALGLRPLAALVKAAHRIELRARNRRDREPRFDPLDDRYYAMRDRIEAAQIRFIRKHPSLFSMGSRSGRTPS